ncbi:MULTISPECIES: RNA-guided endonuclease TnpB family protein [Moorena]|uniref:Transposase, IS605 OrfB family, central region n=1 Tax=Moorena producens 3L TaxID=489825 RepID=F4XPM8_9CYAN|nr:MULTISPECIES: RNA-guided endonuclease TnpB family protein [Moorena]EGJ33482.1 transposase, IS605 OrfB family, central region [Moorena producens 3L]NEP30584.1 IS200/IS605 family element transposase accessory protein TnpB [Moorena sp. SIO3B2]NEP65261.1 IS200/IS605 family element transposase accessory protein TnpB [Moorena sp. SIO3A5]NEQ05680.1 IS200/IS605 family element transposase accessory protein TnpB [Moorena sp. SIO4E2]NER87262.1 IS200/IS605 family element transposase accessory protein T
MYAIKRELKVNHKQANWLAQCAGFSRFVYNYGLGMMKASWEFDHVKASDSKRLNAIKKVFTNVTKKSTELAWCNKYPSRIYQNAFRNLAKALSRWRDPKLKAQMPKFKTKRHQCSFTVDDCNGKRLLFAGKQINIPTLGWFRLKEGIPYNCISQTFTISREVGKWFISFKIDACPVPAIKHTQQKVGIDLGVKCFATLSDRTQIETPESIKKAKTKLSKLQWRNRKKVLGNGQTKTKPSQNALTYYGRLRKQHKHLANIREDFLQKETTRLAQTYQEILIEDLNVLGMLANHKLAEAISLLGFYRFRELLTYKQEFHGFKLTLVDRWFPSSKTCHKCGHKQNMPLKERVYICGGCGNLEDRDLNAAINIERWEAR